MKKSHNKFDVFLIALLMCLFIGMVIDDYRNVQEIIRLEKNLEELLEDKEEWIDQGTLIVDMILQEAQLRAEKEHYEELAALYLENVDVLATLSKMDFLTPEEILRVTGVIPRGNPFLENQYWYKSAGFGESVALHGQYRSNHTGVDIWSYTDNLQALGEGEVIKVARNRVLGLHMTYMIGSTVRITMSHLEKVFYSADVGKIVQPGSTIALMGNSGLSSAKHVHLTIELLIDGEWIFMDPEPYLRR